MDSGVKTKAKLFTTIIGCVNVYVVTFPNTTTKSTTLVHISRDQNLTLQNIVKTFRWILLLNTIVLTLLSQAIFKNETQKWRSSNQHYICITIRSIWRSNKSYKFYMTDHWHVLPDYSTTVQIHAYKQYNIKKQDREIKKTETLLQFDSWDL